MSFPVRRQPYQGRFMMVATATCGHCGCIKTVPVNDQKGFSSDTGIFEQAFIKKKLEQMGWLVGKKDKQHRCSVLALLQAPHRLLRPPHHHEGHLMNTTSNFDPFRVGDTVRVRNIPGPRMVITGIVPESRDRPNNIHCKWFDRRAELHGEWFTAKMLMRTTPWLDKPGYRTALETIRDKAKADPSLCVITETGVDAAIMVGDVELNDFINDVLSNTHPARNIDASESEAEAAE